jgi:hypothetical protein
MRAETAGAELLYGPARLRDEPTETGSSRLSRV